MNSWNILLIEDSVDHATMVEYALSRAKDETVRLHRADRLSAGLEYLAAGGVDAVLLDLGLPDSTLDATLPAVLAEAADVPVVVLTSLDDWEFAARAVQQGAQDFLAKSAITTDLLTRSIRYAIERKRAQIQLERYAAELERSNEQLRHFAHVVAHEVKSPLQVVAYLCAFLKQKHGQVFDDDTTGYLQRAGQSVARLADLMDSLLDFSRIGSRDPEWKPVDSDHVFHEAVGNLQQAIRENDATITHGPLPTVRADAAQLTHLLQNLIGNAIKYRSEAAPRVHVSAERVGDAWHFQVRDNGIGIAADDRERAFALFDRLGRDQCEGTGIGLALCRQIIENHGGRIWVESEPGRGSTFFFSLPTEQEDAEGPAARKERAATNGGCPRTVA